MSKVLSRIVVLCCVASLVACSSMQAVVNASAAPGAAADADAKRLLPNDKLLLTTTDSVRVDLKVSAVSADAIEGTTPGATQVRRFPMSQVALIERRDFDARATTLFVLAIGLGLYFLIHGITAASHASWAASR